MIRIEKHPPTNDNIAHFERTVNQLPVKTVWLVRDFIEKYRHPSPCDCIMYEAEHTTYAVLIDGRSREWFSTDAYADTFAGAQARAMTVLREHGKDLAADLALNEAMIARIGMQREEDYIGEEEE